MKCHKGTYCQRIRFCSDKLTFMHTYLLVMCTNATVMNFMQATFQLHIFT